MVYFNVFWIEIFGVLFVLSWSATVCYFMYSLTKSIDTTLNHGSTNCTILDASYDSDDGWGIHVNYTVPGNSYNYTSWLGSTDDKANYHVNDTIPCYYALHDHSYVIASEEPVNGGTIFGLIVVSIFCTPVAIGVLFILFFLATVFVKQVKYALETSSKVVGNAAAKVSSIFKRTPDDTQNESDTSSQHRSIRSCIARYLMVPVTYCKEAFRNMTSWMMKKFTWTKSDLDQSKDAFALEDQESLSTRASSGYSYRSTKKLLSYSKSQRSDISDLVSIETRSL
ncbi:hypothetical protein BGW37DRAFT_491868 [Umbelopsis sp. PMI_123]|nr:hypothetical protein BGW37DRAFT_491868 [Umbelopsis sp. PMI_123]